MQAPLIKKNDMKLLILYIMSKIGYPLDYVTLNDMATTDGLMTGFDFTECFAELLDAGNVTEFKNEARGEVYGLTEQGKRVIENLEGNLLSGIREQAYKSAVAVLNFNLSGRVTKCEVERSDSGKPLFTGTVEDSTGLLFSLTIQAETDGQAALFRSNWEKRPEHVFKTVLALLSGDADYLLQ